ncbi:MAG: hypothetical protein JJE04_18950 [Acidobacteriia bacterium]|nr:hypothetical protein [Terriglobia bacterium]
MKQAYGTKWESGEKRPSGASLKLLLLVDKNGLGTVGWSSSPRAFRSFQ